MQNDMLMTFRKLKSETEVEFQYGGWNKYHINKTFFFNFLYNSD